MTEVNSFLTNEDSESIRDRYQKVVSVLSAHQIAMWEYDISTGKCSFDDAYFRVLGLDQVGIVYSDMDDFARYIHPDDLDGYRAAFSAMLNSETKTSKIRVRCIDRQGHIVWLEDNFFSYTTDQAGGAAKLVAYTANMTSQYEKEMKIRQLEERNRKVIEALPEFIFIFDENFFITDVLMSESTQLLHRTDELIGGDARTFYSPEVSDLFIRNIRQCLKDGQLKEIEYYLDMDKRYYYQARIAPFEDNKVLALIHDIGDRVQWSEELLAAKHRAEEADRMKSIFLANMSHEIRTPLNAIVGFSELISQNETPEDNEEYIDIIRQNSNLLLQLVGDVLDLSRIESGKSEMHFEQVRIAEWLEEMAKVHRLKMNEGVEMKTVVPEEEIWAYTDRNRMTQVVFNFLSNAVKNTQIGSITLGVHQKGEWLEVFVADTGCGIPEDKLPLIFTRFEKLNDFVQGTGLGLSICQSIAERLGGRIEVKSKVGEGSTFSFYLPYRPIIPGKDLQSSVSTLQEGVVHRSGKRKTILVAEDVEANFMLVTALLKNEYTILRAVNGEEAVSRFMRDDPDLILMDIKMPVMNGIEATEKIRAISSTIPIIGVTAHAFYSEQQRALDAGCNAIVSKPYSLDDLKRTVDEYLM